MRIVSTVPSITELLYSLGLDEEVVAITKFCVHPDKWYRSKARIGGTKTLDVDKILGLKPDLILANKEENVKEQVETLQSHVTVSVTEIKTVADSLQLVLDIGKLVNRVDEADLIYNHLSKILDQINRPIQQTAAYIIWNDPVMSVGKDTYIHAMMEHCGLANVFGDQTRYPSTSLEELALLSPDVILLSSEPFPFKDKHIVAYQAAVPSAEVRLFEGEAFSWYGSRLLALERYLVNHFGSDQQQYPL